MMLDNFIFHTKVFGVKKDINRIGIELFPWEAIDIDNIEDWEFAKQFKLRKRNSHQHEDTANIYTSGRSGTYSIYNALKNEKEVDIYHEFFKETLRNSLYHGINKKRISDFLDLSYVFQ